MNLLDGAQIARYLESHGLIGPHCRVTVEPLPGGVSSDVALVSCGDRRWVLKQALPKLKVAADWRADVHRGQVERMALQEVARIVPGSVPQVVGDDDGSGVLVMQFVDGVVWKSELLAGRIDTRTAQALGHFLGRLHEDSRRRIDRLSRFDDKSLFYQLRIAPYFEVLYDQYPDAQQHALQNIVDSLMQTAEVLIHGDFSPKNVIVPVSGHDPIVLDWEVAHVGHPAFDLGFMMHHLWLKAIFRGDPRAYGRLVESFYAAYESSCQVSDSLKATAIRTTGALMLARVDGKSPVDYLSKAQRDTARRVGGLLVLGHAESVADVESLVREEMG
jgi:5-methylthioribose kinase